MSGDDIVFLVPGFLGFERAGNFSNFADRVCSALRSHLEGRLLRPVEVVPVSSLPTTTFADRQRALLLAMSRRLAQSGSAQRIHLLGHSVGGIDAYLLGCAQPVGGGDFSALDPLGLRARLRTVVSLGTPHHGTCLAEAPGAGHARLGTLLRDREGALAAAQLVNKLFASALRDLGSSRRAAGLFREGRKVSHFMAELLRWQGFLPALTPTSMEALYELSTRLPHVTVRSFVTMAGEPRTSNGASAKDSPRDSFFEELSSRTKGPANGFTRHSSAVRGAIARLREAVERADAMVVSNSARAPSHVDGQTNDGLVNAARQLVDPNDDSELAGIVVADHFDVLGYYDRSLVVLRSRAPGRASTLRELDGEHALLSGLLHSGSGFRDAEFFALYRRIGDVIFEQCQAGVDVAPAAVAQADQGKRKAQRRTAARRPTA